MVAASLMETEKTFRKSSRIVYNQVNIRTGYIPNIRRNWYSITKVLGTRGDFAVQ
jgi:hypothetical protein